MSPVGAVCGAAPPLRVKRVPSHGRSSWRVAWWPSPAPHGTFLGGIHLHGVAMMPSYFRAAWLGAPLLATTVLAGCGGSDVLGPPDAPACTVGTIAAGDSVSGNVSASSCMLWSDYNYGVTRAASWTLHAEKNTAYIVRLRHQEDAHAFDNWSGDLVLYGRNAHGDPEFETGWWNSFGAVNGNGGENEEMMLATDRDQTWSIRVEAASPADTGAHTDRKRTRL